ncbi:unnamed protein product [Symbiodinium sp. CCMP2456]|nr:unnamed protein product [Symbiodinium sp. CCMP2456]
MPGGPRCFVARGEGSEELLAALGRSRKLEEVNFARCGKIPAAAWESLPDGAWPRLRLADLSEGDRPKHLERLRKASPDIEAGAGGWSARIVRWGTRFVCGCGFGCRHVSREIRSSRSDRAVIVSCAATGSL